MFRARCEGMEDPPELPTEIWFTVFELLSAKDIGNCLLVNRRWSVHSPPPQQALCSFWVVCKRYHLAGEGSLWKVFCREVAVKKQKEQCIDWNADLNWRIQCRNLVVSISSFR